MSPAPTGHETWGWDGSTGYRCCCGRMLTEHSWANAEPLWRAHVTRVTPPGAREVWDGSVAPGGYVCSECGMPCESEPCEHLAFVLPPETTAP